MTPPELHFSPSRLGRFFMLCLHVTVLAVSLTLPKLWCGLAIIATIVHYLWQLHSSQAVVQHLQALPEGLVLLTDARGVSQNAQVLPSSLIAAHLLVLHLRTESRNVSLVIWPDNADASSLRAWRVWLRWVLPAVQSRVASEIAGQSE